MVARRTTPSKTQPSRRRPATTPEAREDQLISLAVDLAEKQMTEGSASAQVISHYLKLGSSREKLEQERIRKENQLLDAKRESLEAAARVEELYKSALSAMRSYSGQEALQITEEPDD